MADPLSALSLACNVLQIIEYGAKILTKTAEYHSAADGAPSEQTTLRGVVQSLKGLNTELAACIPLPSSTSPVSGPKARLIAANNECLRLSNEFLELLDQLTVTKKHSVLESFRMSVKSMRYEEKVAAIKAAIGEARNNLNIAFLVFMQHTSSERHDELLKTNTDTESRIVEAFRTASYSMEEDIKLLTKQLSSISLSLIEDDMAKFKTSNRDALNVLSRGVNAILVQHGSSRMLENVSTLARQTEEAQHRILESLYFPEMKERRNRIATAHQNTYEWVLRPDPSMQNCSDNFMAWARSQEEERRIYWIRGKPGSGKSTLIRFIDETLDTSKDLLPWGEPGTVCKVGCFFWGPGTPLQKSWAGLLRSLLSQMLEQVPDHISELVPLRTWRKAQSSSTSNIEWPLSDLVRTLLAFVSADIKRVFFLIDGLDEFNGNDKERDDLLELLHSLSTYKNVKLCVSSRPWNVFQDSFEECPQLRLESLTQGDISRFVNETLGAHRRFLRLRRSDPGKAEFMVSSIVDKASGVFLWVRLVVHELLKGLRDGDSVSDLIATVEAIPDDLNAYFTRLMESIPPKSRKEASVLFQIALHQETTFTTAHPLRLVDVMYTEECMDNFALDPGYHFNDFDMANVEEMDFRLDSAKRRLNSRCLGLLECQYMHNYTEELVNVRSSRIPESDVGDLGGTMTNGSIGESTGALLAPFNWHVDFLHRTVRDFLLTPLNQQKLCEYAGGTFDARRFLCNARLVQVKGLNSTAEGRALKIAITSYLLSAIAVPELNQTSYSETIAVYLKPVMEEVVQYISSDMGGWYLSHVLRYYEQEKSTFLTVAIDFNLVAYVRSHLTQNSIRNKKGRPILDHILTDRFSEYAMEIGNLFPHAGLLSMALHLGADPNELWKDQSVWTSFLVLLNDDHISVDSDERNAALQKGRMEAVGLLLQYGANPILPTASLHFSSLSAPRSFTTVAAYLEALRPFYRMAKKELKVCVVLASEKAANISSE